MIDIPEECKTADEILNAYYEIRKNMIETGVFNFAVRFSGQQSDALKDCKRPLFDCPDGSIIISTF